MSHAIIQLNKRKYNGNDDKDNPTISDEITMPQPRNKPASYPGLALKAKRFNAFEQGDDESLWQVRSILFLGLLKIRGLLKKINFKIWE